jgi:hypothetical protein
MWCALSDERMGLSFVCAAGPCQRSLSRVLVPWDLRPYFIVSDLRLPFSSPPTTRRVTVEVFDPASTRVIPSVSECLGVSVPLINPLIAPANNAACFVLRNCRTRRKHVTRYSPIPVAYDVTAACCVETVFQYCCVTSSCCLPAAA